MDWLKRILNFGGTPVAPDVDWHAVLATANDTLTAMVRPAVALDMKPGERVGAGDASSVGGRPGLPDGMAWPLDTQGAPMLFVAQINFADMPPIPDYPARGLLSFWVTNEDVFGCEFPSRGQRGFRTLWFEEPAGFTRRDPPEYAENWSPMGRRMHAEGAPLLGRATSMPPPAGCNAFDQFAQDWLKDCPRAVSDKLFDKVAESRPACLYYGGFPDFVQYDIRDDDQLRAHDRVLLQMGFCSGDRDWEICWGDAGEATFLIEPDALEKRQFERSIFSWDCG